MIDTARRVCKRMLLKKVDMIHLQVFLETFFHLVEMVVVDMKIVIDQREVML
jgi:hypothetical protein